MRVSLSILSLCALLLLGCTSAPYVPSGTATATLSAGGNAGLAPLALPSLSATLAPPAPTTTPTPKPTATPAPTPTPKPTGACTVQMTSLGYNSITGKQQYSVKGVFSNRPADVQVASIGCVTGATGDPQEIRNEAVERICSYANSNRQTVTVTAGVITCEATIG